MIPAEMNAALTIASAHAEPIIPNGWQVPNGYTLRGPRGRKRTIGVDANGNVDAFDVRFFVDCVAASDERITMQRKGE